MLRLWTTRTAALVFSVIFGAAGWSSQSFAQALPIINNVAAPLLSTPGAYALAGGGATAANMGSFAPAVGAGAGVLVGTGALAVGTLLGYELMGLVLGDGENNAAVPLTGDPNEQPPAPNAPGTAGAITKYDGLDSVDAACSAYATANSGVAQCFGLPAHTVMSVTSTSATHCYVHKVYTLDSNGSECGVYDLTYGPTPSTGCPAGYSGSPCVLQNARLAAPDNRNDVTRSGTGFAAPADADSNDPTVPKGQISTTTNPNDTWQVVGQSSSGNPILIKVQNNPGGGSTVRLDEQVQDLNQNSFVRTRMLEISPEARVISDSQALNPASISYDPVTQSPTVNTSTSSQPYQSPEPQQITVNTCGLPGQAACAIDDSAFAGTRPTLNVPDADLNKQKTAIEEAQSLNPGFMANLVPHLLPGSASACTPLQFRGAVSVGEVNVDSTADLDLCWVFEIIRAVLGYLAWLAGVLYVWRRFTGSPTGA